VSTVVDGRYRIERFAGEGGFGVVYRAFHLGFEHAVALKVLKLPEHWSRTRREERIEAFHREGRMLFELSLLHPTIVRAFETGTVVRATGLRSPYLALEWLDGVGLDEELKQRRRVGHAPWSLGEVLHLLEGPARALERAHARGIAHRDIKPGNLFLTTREGEPAVRILDFGVAKLSDDRVDSGGDAGAPASFTPMYAAPEQWVERLGPTGPSTDVYALALVCVELLTGRAPFRGRGSTELMAACLDPARRPTPKLFGLELAPDVERAFACALALDPRERFRNAGDFWRALSASAGENVETGAVPFTFTRATAIALSRTKDPAVMSGSVTTDPTVSCTLSPGNFAVSSPPRLVIFAGIALGLALSAHLPQRFVTPPRGALLPHHPPASTSDARAAPSRPEAPDSFVDATPAAPEPIPVAPIQRARHGMAAVRAATHAELSSAQAAPSDRAETPVPVPSGAPHTARSHTADSAELPDVAAVLMNSAGVNFDDPALTRRR
jgi:serine/threonine-protein kinase